MNTQTLKSQLIVHEGFKAKPYKCTADKLTIGYGRNLEDNGISHAEASYMLENDIRVVLLDLHELFPHWGELPELIQLVLADMRFNLGPQGLRSFRKMLFAVEQRNWEMMQEEMVQSRWYDQVGMRATRLCQMVDEVIARVGD